MTKMTTITIQTTTTKKKRAREASLVRLLPLTNMVLCV